MTIFYVTGTLLRFILQVLTLPPHNPLRHKDFLFLDEETQVKLSYLSKFTQSLESNGIQHPGSEWPCQPGWIRSFVVHTEWCSSELYSYPCIFKPRCYFKSVSPLQGVRLWNRSSSGCMSSLLSGSWLTDSFSCVLLPVCTHIYHLTNEWRAYEGPCCVYLLLPNHFNEEPESPSS